MIDTLNSLAILLSSILMLFYFSNLSFSLLISSIVFCSWVFLLVEDYLALWYISPVSYYYFSAPISPDVEFYFFSLFLDDYETAADDYLSLDYILIFGGF